MSAWGRHLVRNKAQPCAVCKVEMPRGSRGVSRVVKGAVWHVEVAHARCVWPEAPAAAQVESHPCERCRKPLHSRLRKRCVGTCSLVAKKLGRTT